MLSDYRRRSLKISFLVALAVVVAGCGTQVAGGSSTAPATRAIRASAPAITKPPEGPTAYQAGDVARSRSPIRMPKSPLAQSTTPAPHRPDSSNPGPGTSADGPAPGDAALTIERTVQGLVLTGVCPAPSRSVAINMSGQKDGDRSLAGRFATVSAGDRFSVTQQFPYATGHPTTPFTSAQALCYSTSSTSSAPPGDSALVASSTLVPIGRTADQPRH